MSLKISPPVIGIITAIAMMISTITYHYVKDIADPRWQYLILFIYAAGIAWSLIHFDRTIQAPASFSEYFGQGFRCFIVVTLIIVLFTYIFLRLFPEYALNEAAATRVYFTQQGDKTPAEIDELVERAKKQYPITIVSVSIFRYLILGALVTAGVSVFLTRRK